VPKDDSRLCGCHVRDSPVNNEKQIPTGIEARKGVILSEIS